MTWKVCPNCWQSNAVELSTCRRCSAPLEDVPIPGKSVASDESSGPEDAKPVTSADQQSFTNEELWEMLFRTTDEIRQLRGELQALKKSLPNSMILDRNLLKRALAVYGHTLLISMIVSVLFFCLMQLLSL